MFFISLLKYYKSLNSNDIFILCVLFCILHIYFKNILYTCIAFIIIYLIINTYKSQNILEENFINNELFPKSKYIEKNDDIKNFLFFIQDFYYYSPENYVYMILYINKFLNIYDKIKINNNLAGKLYNILEKTKFIILHYMIAFKLNCPDDRKIIEKINNNIINLEKKLNNYLYDVYEKNKINITNTGYNINTHIINLNLKYPYNETFIED